MEMNFNRVSQFICITVFVAFCSPGSVAAQDTLPAVLASRKLPVSAYIRSLDTLLHMEMGVKRRVTDYRLYYPSGFRLFLSPNVTNSISIGGYYRYVDLSTEFSTAFFNPGQNNTNKGKTTIQSIGTGFSIDRFYLRGDFIRMKGFYLANSEELGLSRPTDPYFLFPDFATSELSFQLRYNTNPRYSTSALNSGIQVQLKSAWSVIPTFHAASFTFRNKAEASVGLENESTRSYDLNLMLPVAGTWAVSEKFYLAAAAGPSIGVDFFKSLSYNLTRSIQRTNGTNLSTGFLARGSAGYNARRFYAGADINFRNYGHKLQELDRMNKRNMNFVIYAGWRFRAPGWTRKTLDWINKTSPIKFE